MNLSVEIENALKKINLAQKHLRQLSSEQKNAILLKLSELLTQNESEILDANILDIKALGKDKNSAFLDRLTLNSKRIAQMKLTLEHIANMEDPCNQEVERSKLPNGLLLRQIRSPLGVLLIVFESRPNVIIEATALAIKSSNCLILRGGSESKNTAEKIYSLISTTIQELGLDFNPILGINDYNRDIIKELLQRKDQIDVVIPRGGEGLISFVQENARMPIIKNDRGMCHAYIDESAKVEMAVSIVKNAKTQHPGVCNSLETVLVHRSIAKEFIEKCYESCLHTHLNWRADLESLKILKGKSFVTSAVSKDWSTEHLDLIINCKVVSSLEEAISHIELYGSKHSECIITESVENARRFQEEVDAAAVYWNASTRFTDGFEFGLGGELGISTQKIHVRGPVGLRELSTPRWVIDGMGQIREG